MPRTYFIEYYPNGDMRVANCRRLSERKLSWKRAVKVVYWLRRRGIVAFAY
jgi:hypothetical protein